MKCTDCTYQESMNCPTCLVMEKPFWGDSCPVKACCEQREHRHCGECADFPCTLLESMAYAEQEGDNGQRIATCREWLTEG